jgi:hypothetical protein
MFTYPLPEVGFFYLCQYWPNGRDYSVDLCLDDDTNCASVIDAELFRYFPCPVAIEYNGAVRCLECQSYCA